MYDVCNRVAFAHVEEDVATKLKNQTVLVVDHDPAVGAFLEQILTDEGYRVRAAPDLDAAVKLLSSLRVDLVICNYVEPAYKRGDRWPVLELFKQLANPGTPFIVLTTSPEDMQQNARELGVSDVIGKPFELDTLVQRVARAIAERRAGATRRIP